MENRIDFGKFIRKYASLAKWRWRIAFAVSPEKRNASHYTN
jgi:hypothetical protein